MIGFLTMLAALWMAPACETGVCSCVPPRPVAESREAADAVFTGRVLSVRDTVVGRGTPYGENRMRRVLIRVDRAWKGVELDSVMVLTSTSDASCGFPFERGEAYIVYASGSVYGAHLAHLCSRTAPLGRAAADLRALGEPVRHWP